jgi:glucose/arabinose dehydrogenase
MTAGAHRLERMILAIGTIAAVTSCCCGVSSTPLQEYGPRPDIPQAHPPSLPTLRIALPEGWPANAKPATDETLFRVDRFAEHLEHPRWLHVLPDGSVLVAESDVPAEYGCGTGIEGWLERVLMHIMGSRTKSADRISLY